MKKRKKKSFKYQNPLAGNENTPAEDISGQDRLRHRRNYAVWFVTGLKDSVTENGYVAIRDSRSV